MQLFPLTVNMQIVWCLISENYENTDILSPNYLFQRVYFKTPKVFNSVQKKTLDISKYSHFRSSKASDEIVIAAMQISNITIQNNCMPSEKYYQTYHKQDVAMPRHCHVAQCTRTHQCTHRTQNIEDHKRYKLWCWFIERHNV